MYFGCAYKDCMVILSTWSISGAIWVINIAFRAAGSFISNIKQEINKGTFAIQSDGINRNI